MKVTTKLSSSIVKAYIKRDKKRISFHLTSHLLIPTTKYFNSIELKKLEGNFKLSTGEKINFTKTTWVVSDTDYDYSFNGKTKVICIYLSTIADFKTILSGVIDIEIFCSLGAVAHLTATDIEIKTSGLLRKMYDERRF